MVSKISTFIIALIFPFCSFAQSSEVEKVLDHARYVKHIIISIIQAETEYFGFIVKDSPVEIVCPDQEIASTLKSASPALDNIFAECTAATSSNNSSITLPGNELKGIYLSLKNTFVELLMIAARKDRRDPLLMGLVEWGEETKVRLDKSVNIYPIITSDEKWIIIKK